MALIQRKARPIKRNLDSFRDDRLFIVACDDSYAPKQYFDFFSIPRIQVHVVATPLETTTCHAIDVLNRLKEIECKEYDERWMLLDTDHYIQGKHLKSFKSALKQAREAGIKVALSRPCFEVWLLLHHVDYENIESLVDAKQVENLLKKTLGSYSKTKLKQDNFSLESVPNAYFRAEKLDQQNTQTIPSQNTTRVYKLWQSIVEQALPSQLPIELKSLTRKGIS